jgi:soluble lytic murein transglycosylase-like protein
MAVEETPVEVASPPLPEVEPQTSWSPATPPAVVTPKEDEPKKSKTLTTPLIVGAVAVGVLIVGSIAVFANRGNDDNSALPSTSETTQAVIEAQPDPVQPSEAVAGAPDSVALDNPIAVPVTEPEFAPGQIYPPDETESLSISFPPNSRPVPVYTDAKRTSITLTTAYSTIDDPNATFPQLVEAGKAQQLIYRSMAINPSLEAEVLSQLEGKVRDDTRSQVDTSKRLRSITKLQPALPKWRIVPTIAPDELISLYKEASATSGIDWRYLAAINIVESRVGRIRGASSAGAQGPMQFLPKTWAAYGRGSIESYPDAIQAAARYLVDHGAPGNMSKALYAYNHSDPYVASIQGYVEKMRVQPNRFVAYYGYQVIFRSQDGDIVLDTGYDNS